MWSPIATNESGLSSYQLYNEVHDDEMRYFGPIASLLTGGRFPMTDKEYGLFIPPG